jgi:two-component system sensor histidine kinase/response regulator
LDFDLGIAVEGAVELLVERARENRVKLVSLVHDDLPTDLRGDPGRLRQVLINLISNAIKFSENGQVTVVAEMADDTVSNVRVRFSITDTGIGISETAQRELFQAFQQADGSTTRKYGGTGLGLAISKQLVELMGGQIGVKSSLGKGSTFWFTARFEKQLSGVTTRAPMLGSLTGLRGLIVDDGAANRTILSHQLDSWGMIHTEAESGAQALDLLRAAAMEGAPFDLAVLDLMMPEMDGFELARTIKADPDIAQVHIVLLTSFGQYGQGDASRNAGVAAFMTKPVRQSHLFDCLRRVMSMAPVMDPVRAPAVDLALAGVPPKVLNGAIQAAQIEKGTSHKRILIAEDNVVNQKVALRQLEKLGYRADVVGDGNEVLEALERIPYDLILMDCQMPNLDGYEATAEIRRREAGSRHVRIVAMTAHALLSDRGKCLAAGMDGYLSKPVRIGDLEKALNMMFAEQDEPHLV